MSKLLPATGTRHHRVKLGASQLAEVQINLIRAHEVLKSSRCSNQHLNFTVGDNSLGLENRLWRSSQNDPKNPRFHLYQHMIKHIQNSSTHHSQNQKKNWRWHLNISSFPAWGFVFFNSLPCGPLGVPPKIAMDPILASKKPWNFLAKKWHQLFLSSPIFWATWNLGTNLRSF